MDNVPTVVFAVELTGRIDQQSWCEGDGRQYKTELLANEIMIVRSAPGTEQVMEPAATAADTPAQPDTNAAPTPTPKRRRTRHAA